MKHTKDSKVIKVESWGKDQGDHVLIYEDDFDKKLHKLYDPEAKAKAAPAKKKAAAKKKADAKAEADKAEK